MPLFRARETSLPQEIFLCTTDKLQRRIFYDTDISLNILAWLHILSLLIGWLGGSWLEKAQHIQFT